MLDIKFLRENPDVVKQNIKNKFQDRKLPLVDEVIELHHFHQLRGRCSGRVRRRIRRVCRTAGQNQR